MADPLEEVPLLSHDKNGGDDPDYEDVTPLSIDPPPYSDLPPTNGLKQSIEYNDPPPAILPSSQPPQYDPQEYQAEVLILQQPTTVIDSKEQRSHRPEDYHKKFLLLIICSTIACCVACWPLALAACVITCVAIRQNNKNHNPQLLINAAFIIIVIAFILGVPITVIYFVLLWNDQSSAY